jgi:hypothetical protein
MVYSVQQQGYRLANQGTGVWFSAGVREYSLVYNARTGVHTASNPVGTEGSFVVGAEHPQPSRVEVKNVWAFICTHPSHCMIYGKTLVGVESWLPWTGVTINQHSLLLPFSSLLEQSAQSIFTFPSCAWIRCSLPFRRSLHLLNLVSLSFGSFCFKHFLPILQSLSYGTPGETKLQVLLTAGACCTVFFLLT